MRCSAARALVLGATLLTTLPVAEPARADDVCARPDVLVVLDRSSSMADPLAGGMTKWEAAVGAIRSLADRYAAEVALGLMLFPMPSACEPGEIVVRPALDAGAALAEALETPPPSTGAYTPMAESLRAAGAALAALPSAAPRHLILVSDGWQWCDPHDPGLRFAPVDAVAELAAAGVTVHVIGFGAGVDVLTLHRMAVAAGTPAAGCDPSADPGADPGAPRCYRQADEPSALSDALAGVTARVVDERCDGVDNDCDGEIDEGFDSDGDGFPPCGVPADCDDHDARLHPVAAELCDGVDNDCDGAVDVGCDCAGDVERACELGGADAGACAGLERCVAGRWLPCEPVATAAAEVCDGVDNDCDGLTDEAARCPAGSPCVDGRCAPRAPEVDGGGCACASAPGRSGLRRARLPWAALALVLLGVGRRRTTGRGVRRAARVGAERA